MARGDSHETEWQDRLLAEIPQLRALALMLTGDKKHADDLTRSTVLQALSDSEKIGARTGLDRQGEARRSDPLAFRIRLVKTLRSCFQRNPVSVTPRLAAGAARSDVLAAAGAPFDHAHFRRAFWQLRPDQREILMLTGASGFPIEAVAEIRQCNVSVARSHATRARNLLKKILEREARAERRKTAADKNGHGGDGVSRRLD